MPANRKEMRLMRSLAADVIYIYTHNQSRHDPYCPDKSLLIVFVAKEMNKSYLNNRDHIVLTDFDRAFGKSEGLINLRN